MTNLNYLPKLEVYWRIYFLAIFCLAFMACPLAQASVQLDVGFEDAVTFPSGTSSNGSPTGEKPQSKLWFNDDSWWSSLWSTSVNAFTIHRLDLTLDDWVDTGTQIDTRNDTKADALWDGTKLYILSNVFFPSSGVPVPTAERGRLYRYSYNSSTTTYMIDAGFPVDVSDSKSETQVLAKDSTGRLWVTYTRGQQVIVTHSGTDDLDWDPDNRPFVIPTGDTNTSVASDDISSIIAFSGSNGSSNVGVLWSNGTVDTMYFALHPDSASPDQGWSNSVVTFNGTGDDASDDHINLKALPAGDPAGTIFAVTKTSESSPRKMLLVCQANSDCAAPSDWTAHTVFIENSNYTNPTRGIVQIDTDNRDLYVLITADEPLIDKAIYYKVTDLDNILFPTPTGVGTPFIQDSGGERPNNISSGKQLVNDSTGLAGLATYRLHYDHNLIDLGPGTPDITVTPASHNYGDVLIGGPESQSFEIRNNGTADLTISDTTLLGSAEFSIDSDDAPFTLAPGASQNIVVSFNPTATGPQSGALKINSNDPDENPVNVALDGTGVETPPSVVTFEEVQTGGSTSSATVITSSTVIAANNQLYIAAIASKSFRAVTSVTGLGLIWTPVDDQCGGRNATGVEVWMAQGTPTGNDTVTATLASAPSNATIAVARYSGADTTNPIGDIVSVNTNGVGGGCSGGIDDNAYSFNLTTTANGSVVYGAIAMRNRVHTPGLGYTEKVEFVQGSGGAKASVAAMDQTISGASTVTVDGTFNSNVDYAVIGLEIKPDGGGPTDPDITVTPISHDYGDVLINASAPEAFEVRNDGTSDLTVTGASIVGGAEFATDSSGAPFTLAPGASQDVVVTFNPTVVGAQSDTLQITSNDPDESTVDVLLDGNGLSSGGGSAIFPPTDDARVNFGFPTSNYGADDILRVRDAGSSSHESYLKFAVTGLTGSPTSAILRLFVTDSSPDGGDVYVVGDNSWDESTINANNAPGISGSPIASTGTVTNGTLIEVDITSAITGSGTYSFGLRSGSSNSAFYSSKEGGNPPELVILP